MGTRRRPLVTVALAGVLGATLGYSAASEPATASPVSEASRYLRSIQNTDGGLGSARGQPSSPRYTGWAALGIAAGGRNPHRVSRRGGTSLLTHRAKGGQSGIPMVLPMAQIVTLRDGKMIRFDVYDDRSEALAAAGLRE